MELFDRRSDETQAECAIRMKSTTCPAHPELCPAGCDYWQKSAAMDAKMSPMTRLFVLCSLAQMDKAARAGDFVTVRKLASCLEKR